jgi:hypothetical protein
MGTGLGMDNGYPVATLHRGYQQPPHLPRVHADFLATVATDDDLPRVCCDGMLRAPPAPTLPCPDKHTCDVVPARLLLSRPQHARRRLSNIRGWICDLRISNSRYLHTVPLRQAALGHDQLSRSSSLPPWVATAAPLSRRRTPPPRLEVLESDQIWPG